MKLNQELLQKYNKPVPRYTSYPPANYFTEDYKPSLYKDDIKSSNNWNTENISLYIHIPFCRKICHYCGCNSSPMAKSDKIRNYVQAIKKEIKQVSSHIDKSRKVSQIHYGGGTPNAIPSEYLGEINSLIESEFSFIANPEIAIECNPACLDISYVNALKETGFNRFSLGIQDFNEQVLRYINRDPSAMPLEELIRLLKEGKDNISVNLDFIYGLPGQTIDSFVKTISKAIDLKPDRLVTFSYAHVPWIKKAQNILEKIGLPEPDVKIEMFLRANEVLKQHGYFPIGLDHYVLKSDELFKALENHTLHRNFQGYCTRRTTGQVYAFGVSSISQLDKAYIQNTKSIDTYIDSIQKDEIPVIKGYRLNQNEMITREVINELMCNKRIIWKNLAEKFNTPEEKIKENVVLDYDQLKIFSDDGIIILSDQAIQVTEDGMLFVRNVAASLDPLYRQQQNLYSKSV